MRISYACALISLLLGSFSGAGVVGMLADDTPNDAGWLAFYSGIALFSFGLTLLFVATLHAELIREKESTPTAEGNDAS